MSKEVLGFFTKQAYIRPKNSKTKESISRQLC